MRSFVVEPEYPDLCTVRQFHEAVLSAHFVRHIRASQPHHVGQRIAGDRVPNRASRELEYRVSAIRIVQCTISRRVCHYESLARSSTANDAGVTLVTLQKLKRLNLFRRETLKAC